MIKKLIVIIILIFCSFFISDSAFAEDARLQLTPDGLAITKDGTVLGTVVEIEYAAGTGYVIITFKDLAGNDAIVITETAGLPVVSGIGFYTTANFTTDFAASNLANLATRNYGDLNGLPTLYDTADFTTDFATESLANLALRTHGSLTGIGASDHHVKYLDADAVSAMGIIGDANPLNHARYSDANAVSAMGVVGNANDLNHDRYADAEAVTSMGVLGDANALNHTRYADAEAVAAVATMGTGNIGNVGTLGVGIATPDASSVADFTSTTLGLLPPRMTTVQRDAIAAPVAGLVIYNTTTGTIDYRNGAAWQTLTEENTYLAEMYMYDAAVTVIIDDANVYHGVYGFSTGSLDEFTFDAGREVDANILTEVDNTDLQIDTSAAHGLIDDDIVTLSNMNNLAHNGVCLVIFVDADTFDCDNIPYVAGAGVSAGRVVEPAYLQAGTNVNGTYTCHFSISGQTVGVGVTFKWELNKNIIPIDTIVAERKHANADIGSLSSSGFVVLIAGDRIWLSTKNVATTTDFVIKHSNVNAHRL